MGKDIEDSIKFRKPFGRLIVACFLVLLAFGAGLFAAYSVFFRPSPGEQAVKFHSADPANLAFYERLYKFSRQKVAFAAAPAAGVIPHHLLAGDLIAEFFSNLEGFDYDTVVLIGPNHFDAGSAKIISSAENWRTPYGNLNIDQELLKKMTVGGQAAVEEDVFKSEHAINAEAAFIKKTFPQAKFLPLVLRPTLTPAEAEDLAENIFAISKTRKILLISSTDFSHYKTSAEAQADDANSLEILRNSSFDDVYGMAVDSPPATYVLLKYANLSNASFSLLRNSNSALLSGRDNIDSTTSYITGYFSAPLLSPASLTLRGTGKEGSGGGSAGAPDGVLPPAADNQLKLLFFGDIMLDRHVGEKIKASGSVDFIFSDLDKSEIFRGNDIVSANLEGAVTDGGAHLAPALAIDFAFSPAIVSELKKYDFNYFNIANNHLADQGKNGIMETEKNLTVLGFDYAGCQDRQIGACTSKIVEKNGRKIGFIGASMVYGKLDEQALIDKVKALATTTDLVVVQMHWGTEYKHEAAANQIALAHKLIEAGADLVIGSHPHVVGGIEIYKGRPIFYSLGNLVFDQYFSSDTQEELGVKIAMDRKSFQIELVPIKSESTRLRLMTEAEKDKFLAKLAGWSIGDDNFKNEIKSGGITISSR